MIAGINDTVSEMQKIRDFLSENGYPERVELLPYHAMGEHKYAAIGKSAQSFSVPTDERMRELRSIF